MADTELGEFYGAVTRSRGAVQSWVNLAGAAVSLAMVVGIGIWGYRLLVRDVTGVPVIRALEGPMRIQPEEPGGAQMAHQGLSVNEVAAAGEAGGIAEAVVLAPEPQELLDHDLPQALLDDRPMADLSSATDAAVAEVLDALGTGEDGGLEPILASAPAGIPPAELIPASVPGVKKSLVPQPRPARMMRAAAVAPEVEQAVAAVEIDADTLPPGSRLVQLGAFESPGKAREVWAEMAQRFAVVMKGKMRVIQQASSNGETFYRLRVAGFADLADARRFCATLAADPSRPLCVPVATR